MTRDYSLPSWRDDVVISFAFFFGGVPLSLLSVGGPSSNSMRDDRLYWMNDSTLLMSFLACNQHTIIMKSSSFEHELFEIYLK